LGRAARRVSVQVPDGNLAVQSLIERETLN